MRATFGAEKDVPVSSRSKGGPGGNIVERTNSGHAAAIRPPACTSGGTFAVRTSSPPYSATSGLITFQILKPDREKADGYPRSCAKVRQPPASNEPYATEPTVRACKLC